MPAKPPKTVTIGGRIITIRIDPKMESWGEYHSDDAEIVLASRTLCKKSTLRETLRHEMMHAALDIAGLTYLKAFEEEAIVRCLDNLFHPAWEIARNQINA